MLQIVFLSSLFIFLITYLAYFLYLRKYVYTPWNIQVDEKFEPEISILIPTHNEEAIIEYKLENIVNVLYPKEKIEIIVADDASDDGTVNKIEGFMKIHPSLNIKLVKQNSRAGKSAALNKALQASTKPIVIVSDADTKWPPDILRKAMPYLADPGVGAVTGRGVNVNVGESWVTRAEESYLQIANFVRLGESKIHSTIRFEGGFCAYKRNAFDHFDCETGSDDSGTALEVVFRGFRTILAPEIVFYTSFPTIFFAKFKVKVRRANQLISLWVKCLKLLFKGRLSLPKRIAVAEIVLFIFNPIIFLILMASSIALIVTSPFSQLSLAIIFSVLGLLVLARRIFIELFINNIILAAGLVTFLFGRRYIAWGK
jgi:cellulose synthase/poly-beta-1,6-N-acetylglucosamine synthase-like glycosyltransferase